MFLFVAVADDPPEDDELLETKREPADLLTAGTRRGTQYVIIGWEKISRLLIPGQHIVDNLILRNLAGM